MPVDRPAAPAIGLLAIAPVKAQTLRFGHANAPGEVANDMFNELAARVAKRTSGAATIKVFPSEQLGKEADLVQQVKTGALDRSAPSRAVMSALVPAMASGPFLWKDWTEAETVLRGTAFEPLWAELRDKHNIMPPTKIFYWGWRNFTFTDPDDVLVRGEEFILSLAHGLIAGLIILTIFFRYVLNDPLPWTEEVIVTIFAWMLFIGFSSGFHQRMHIRIDALLLVLPMRGRAALGVIAVFATSITLLGLAWFGAAQALIMLDGAGVHLRLHRSARRVRRGRLRGSTVRSGTGRALRLGFYPAERRGHPRLRLMSATPEQRGRMRVGSMGVGRMGHGAAKNILEKGYPLTVLGNVNRAPVDDLIARGAAEASSPADLVRRCDVLFLCRPSTVEVEQAAYAENGIVSALRPGFILVEATTSDPVSTRRIGTDLRAAGADMVDAPMGRTA